MNETTIKTTQLTPLSPAFRKCARCDHIAAIHDEVGCWGYAENPELLGSDWLNGDRWTEGVPCECKSLEVAR